MREQRRDAIDEATEIVRERMNVSEVHEYTREEADDSFGDSWPVIARIVPESDDRIRALNAARDALKEASYTAVIDSIEGGGVCIKVMVNYDVYHND